MDYRVGCVFDPHVKTFFSSSFFPSDFSFFLLLVFFLSFSFMLAPPCTSMLKHFSSVMYILYIMPFLYLSVCHILFCLFFCSHNSVRGIYVWCQVCGHGGHLQHIQDWHKDHAQCPTGCGHSCAQVKA